MTPPQKYFVETVLSYDGNECLAWPFARFSSGYGKLGRDGKTFTVSRLVCEHVHGAPPTANHHAAHSCGRGKDGCVSQRHLSWKTRAENEADKVIHGTSNRGQRNGQAKLTVEMARQILSMKDKLPRREIAEKLNISRDTVRNVTSGRRWGWLSGASACLLLAIAFPGEATAHDAPRSDIKPQGWSYPFSCCSGIDCREVPDKAISERPEGYIIKATGEVISHGDTRLKNSPDGLFHWCSVAGAEDGRTICLFVPPRSF